MDFELLTTGEAARLCGVTADAVLKWIKKGTLPAIRTSGGHFRIDRRTLEALGYSEQGAPSRAGMTMPAQSGTVPKHCWEYFRRNLAPPETCMDCVVYRARIEKCYEVAELGETIGHSRQFCRATCQNCSFFRACKGLASAVLVVTGDEALIDRLTAQADSAAVLLRFARSGYESSSLVETFHPCAVVMDSALPEMENGRLVNSMMEDKRLLGARIIIAFRKGDRITSSPGTLAMSPPFTLKKIERLIQTAEHPAAIKGSMAS